MCGWRCARPSVDLHRRAADAVAGGLTPDAGTGRWIADATVAGAVAATDLASTTNGLGASLVGVEDAAKGFHGIAALSEFELFPFLEGMDLGGDHAAACLHEAGAFQRDRGIYAHALDQRQEALLNELERRSHRVVRSTFDAQRAGSFCMQQRGQHIQLVSKVLAMMGDTERSIVGNMR